MILAEVFLKKTKNLQFAVMRIALIAQEEMDAKHAWEDFSKMEVENVEVFFVSCQEKRML